MQERTNRSTVIGIAIFSLIALPALAITVLRNDAILEFPNQILFNLSAQGEAQIEAVELEFGTDALSCGQSVNRAIPEDFTPGTSIETDWTWNLRRTGAIPPGTNVWWRWILRDSNHDMLETPVQSLQFTDTLYPWKTLETDALAVYWYVGDNDFARSLIDAGEQTMKGLQEMTGVQMEGQIRVYVYATSEEMQSSTLFAPDWSGGLAFPEHSAVLTAIDPSQLDWGRRVVSHELAHVVIGHYTFSCIESLPIWLNEGLAMNAEGQPTDYHTELLQDAIEEDNLQSVRELGEIFSNDPSRASLAYAQSSSLVLFLFNQYGQEMILSLLDAFRDGTPEDQALMNIIGIDRDGLESAWRESVGAAPMKATLVVGPTPTRTPYPTFAPITGPEFAPSETPPLEKMSQIEPSPIAAPTQATTEEQVSPLSSSAFILILAGAGIALASLITWLLIRLSRNR
jgi:hypothetical protein